MALKNDRYTYRATWSEGDGEYVGLCTEFPSLSWLAKTPETVLKGIRKLVADIVTDMHDKGSPSYCFHVKIGITLRINVQNGA